MAQTRETAKERLDSLAVLLKTLFFEQKIKKPIRPLESVDETWPWYFSPCDNSLYRRSPQGWLTFPILAKRTGRPCFSTKGTVPETIPILHRATVYKKGERWVCSGHGPITLAKEKNYATLAHLLASLPNGE